MPTESAIFEILAGTPESTSEVTYAVVGSATVGDPAARRLLVHPSASIPELSYGRNPDRTINFDQVPLNIPNSALRRTLGTTLPFIESNGIDDVVVTEVWKGSDRRASMTASFFRLLFEMVINRPATADPEEFVQWYPNDRIAPGASVIGYNVVLLDLRLGGGPQKLDFNEIGAGVATLDVVATGVLDRQVELDLLIVSEIPA